MGRMFYIGILTCFDNKTINIQPYTFKSLHNKELLNKPISQLRVYAHSKKICVVMPT